MVAADRGSLEAVMAVMNVVSGAHVGTNPSVSFLAGVSVHTVSLPFVSSDKLYFYISFSTSFVGPHFNISLTRAVLPEVKGTGVVWSGMVW